LKDDDDDIFINRTRELAQGMFCYQHKQRRHPYIKQLAILLRRLFVSSKVQII